MFAELINKHSLAHELRPDIVACVILQESEGNTFAFRYEPGFYATYIKDRTRVQLSGWVPGEKELPSLDTEKRARAHSWGLMQVMGETARSIGQFKGRYISMLLDPDIGIDVGCRVLAHYLAREKGDYTRGLARYNAGSVSLQGLIYADKILTRIKNGEYKKLIREEE